MSKAIDRERPVASFFFVFLVLVSALGPVRAAAQNLGSDPDPDVGDYTIGLYADPEGSSRAIRLDDDDDTFTCYLGIRGDPAIEFSGMVLRIEMADFLEPAGPVVWKPLEGLQEKEIIFGEGAEILFLGCDRQPPDAPLILGHFEVAVDPRFREGTVEPLPHERYGLGVQLCNEGDVWPKRNADALPLRVERSVSFWDRVSNWFD
ncbi:MAG TPA: hypothetical protein VKA86_08650 [Candidatus Krumholzibacteria bacterium]|nr:hypothetical protein [Candidatus Krumholzibacteria bacterium]